MSVAAAEPTIRDIDAPSRVPTPDELRHAVGVVCEAITASCGRIRTDPRLAHLFPPDFPAHLERTRGLLAAQLPGWSFVLYGDAAP